MLGLVHSQPPRCSAEQASKEVGIFVGDEKEIVERFGEQEFLPLGGFILKQGMELPNLVWRNPELVEQVVDNPSIPTRWFNERFEEVQTADTPGRYYAYGEGPVPSGPVLRRAMTCCCVSDDVDLAAIARNA